MDKSSLLTAARLREVLNFDPETGIFTWRFKPNRCIRIGDVAGGKQIQGYWKISVDRRAYFAHRLAWLYIHGTWPVDQIDHIDCQKDNNRIANLREAGGVFNSQNQRKAHKNNISGLLGAHWSAQEKKWRTAIMVDGKLIHLGYFPAAEEAHAAYVAAKRKRHASCTI